MAIVLIPSTSAEPITWIGPDGGDWSNPANWDPATVPNNGDTLYDVLIDGDVADDVTVLFDINSTITSLAIDTGDRLTVQNARNLVVTGGPIDNRGLIELASTGSSTDLTVGSPSVTLSGDGEIENRYFRSIG